MIAKKLKKQEQKTLLQISALILINIGIRVININQTNCPEHQKNLFISTALHVIN